MVQRKLAQKPDHVKNENQLHDVKNNNKVADLKKKMKKSGSIKRPEIDGPSFRKHVKQPGKPPPLAAAAPPSPAATTPNYMKSTTSSDARKEQSQVSTTTKSPDSSSLRRKSSNTSKLTLASGNKATKTSASLKTMRTLTKNPSFKPVRASVRKCSPAVVLCENLDAQRGTCSSTLKDCKFPAYLSLNHGGTESEGTSAIKVCPYTYCSLNGHHHAPLPPLKCFLSARRRVIKNQRSVKLGCLSPRRVKGPSFDEKLMMEDDLKSSSVSTVAEEEQKDFFIEIYSERIEDAADETAAEDPEEPICFGVDKDETLDRNGDVPPPVPIQDERKSGFLNELLPIYDELDSEASDMDWGSSVHLDYDYEYSSQKEIESDPETGEVENDQINGEFVATSDKKGGWFDEFLVDEVSQESMDEESLSSDAFSTSEDGDSTDSYDYLQSLIMMKNTALVQVPVEEPEPEPASDDNNHSRIDNQDTDYYIVEEETSSDNLKHKSLQNDVAIAITGDQDETLTSDSKSMTENQENSMTLSSIDPAEEPHSEVALLKSTEAKAENEAISETEDRALARAAAKFKKPIEDTDNESGLFNPRGPNFLPIEPDPEAEKVDLRHQDLDEKKNAEEWMVDYALRQVVTKLGPARKRKVALLVEAFEKVLPITKCDLHLRSSFDQGRPIQTCS